MESNSDNSEFFSIENVSSLSRLKLGARIHVIGVCGVAMAQIALLLSKSGFSVSGSDKEYYDPMASLLRSSKIKLYDSYNSSNIDKDIDLVLIGNSAPRSHPEVVRTSELGLKFTFFPKLLHELIIEGRKSVVVSGTHGKSTTTALIAHALRESSRDPSYFVGAAVPDLPLSLYSGKGGISVVEGDEYDSAFFAKIAKFHFYKPDLLVINAIEFDHADIYPNLESIVLEFAKLIESMPPNSKVFACHDCPNVKELAKRFAGKINWVSFGEEAQCDLNISEVAFEKGLQKVQARRHNGESFSFQMSLSGLFNAKNALACYAVCQELAIPAQQIERSLINFNGVERRQQLHIDGDITLIEDFAHHPTAVREIIKSLRLVYPNRRIWVILDPRSNTSRRSIFQNEFKDALLGADRITIRPPETKTTGMGLLEATPSNLLNTGLIVSELVREGKQAEELNDPAEILKLVKAEKQSGDVICIMSNGSFGGLTQLLKAALL